MDNEKQIWDFLNKEGFSDYGKAGVLANIHAESAARPDNLQDSGNRKLGVSDVEYTEAVDKGQYPREKFSKDSIGYGLCQWTYWSRKQALYDYAKQYNKSIGDLEMQLCFMIKEFKQYGILNEIKNATSYEDATRVMMLEYEKPANTSEQNIQTRIGYAEIYYNRYVSNIQKDLQTLVQKGIISSPEYWLNVANTVEYFPQLIHNVAEALK